MTIEIANRLIELRKRKGLSQEELAEKLGISRQAVSKWERAESGPDVDNAILLSRLYNISLDELFNNKPEYERELDDMEPDMPDEPEEPVEAVEPVEAEEDDVSPIEIEFKRTRETVVSASSTIDLGDDIESRLSGIGSAVEAFVSDIVGSVASGTEKPDRFTDSSVRTSLKAPDNALSGSGDYSFEGIRSIYVNARADLELAGTDSDICTVCVEGPEKETARCRLWQEEDELRIITEDEKRFVFALFGHGRLKLKVSLPRSCERAELNMKGGDLCVSGADAQTLIAHTGGGDIDIDDCGASVLEAKAGGGEVKLKGVTADSAEITCGGGDVEANGLDISGTLTLFTGGGDISADCIAGVVEAKSGGGDIKLRAKAETIELKTGGGDIALKSAGASRITAKTGGGDIAAELTECSGIATDVATIGGEASIAFKGTRIGSGRKLGLTAGDGSVKLEMRSGGGDIKITAE